MEALGDVIHYLNIEGGQVAVSYIGTTYRADIHMSIMCRYLMLPTLPENAGNLWSNDARTMLLRLV